MPFKGALGSHFLLQQKVCHQVGVLVTQEVINKDGGSAVAPLCQSPFQLGKEPNLSGYHLVNRHALPWLGCLEHCLGFLFSSPRIFSHGAKSTSGANWWQHIGKVFRNFANLGQVLELW